MGMLNILPFSSLPTYSGIANEVNGAVAPTPPPPNDKGHIYVIRADPRRFLGGRGRLGGGVRGLTCTYTYWFSYTATDSGNGRQSSSLSYS